MSDVARPSFVRVLIRGLTRRCPRCGRGDVFRHWLKIEPRCPGCGYPLVRDENSFLGSLTINYAITGIAFIAYLIVMLVLTLPDPPVLKLTLGAVAITVLVPLIVYPFGKTLWAALDLLSHRDTPDESRHA